MFDTEKFIQCVRENHSIWDRGSQEYIDRNLKHQSWLNIGQRMFDKWTKMSEKVKQEQVKEMKNKWRHIRDNYNKYMNQKRRGSSASKKRKYVYADALSFLLQTLDKKKLTEETEEDNLNPSSQDDEASHTSGSTGIVQERSHKRPLLRKIKISRAESGSCFENLEKINYQKTDAEDADKYFLLSLLPDYKRLNDDEKLQFRLHTLQFFQNIRMQFSLTKDEQLEQP